MEQILDFDEEYGISKRNKGKGVVKSEQEVDRIKDLPDSILIHILSLLPTRDAVRTLIIPSFGRLWTSIYNLDFDWCLYHDCWDNSPLHYRDDESSLSRFAEFVRHVLALHQGSRICKFRLRFEFSIDRQLDDLMYLELEPEELEVMIRTGGLAGEVNRWIEHAVNRNAEILDLDFLACGFPTAGYKYELPGFVLQSSFLTELKLVSCKVNVSTTIVMRALKVLYLKEIALRDDSIKNFIDGCPGLESLTVLDCYGLCELNCASQILRSVTVAPGILEESKVKVACPNIKSLSISGWIERLELENLSSLRDASVDFCDCFFCVPDEYCEVQKILEELHQVRVLTMHHHPILVLTIWELTDLACPTNSWQRLNLRTMLTKWHLPGIANVLRSSPSLEVLDIHIIPGEVPSTAGQEAWLHLYQIGEGNYWDLQDHSFGCLTGYLRIVRVSGDITNEHAMQLVQFLLRKALVLQKLVVSWGPNDCSISVEESKEYSDKLLSFPRCSPQAVVLFSNE
ncbi:putative F-box/LRR-repeat protein At3g18150 [Rhodamnia argentea]|uniref:F-box/LRR-repeat protein At3g18150 n=1 Tax=Rhodamnia argentea TaxID=178133 RepID=A0ABM3GSR5_9MYRT|nr:putative F-box/LRR-repeat protein At3g18150 [Rhodamnia argentea]